MAEIKPRAAMMVPKNISLPLKNITEDRTLLKRLNAIQKRSGARNRAETLRRVINAVYLGGGSGVSL